LEKVRHRNMTIEEYFDLLLSYKVHKSTSGYLTKDEFQKGLQIENFNFTLQEIAFLFNLFDIKKDNVLDRDEWLTKLKTPSDPLFRIQDLIKKNGLEIEDILHRMDIHPKLNEAFDLTAFKHSTYKMIIRNAAPR
jgi:Ca2+-binding EF-hand superfamily protein